VIEVAKRLRTEPAVLVSTLRRDLDWIVLKCLEKDRARRYETAGALAEDIGRYLDHQPVLARPPSAGYKLRKFVRRNRGAVLAGAVVASTMMIAAGVSVAFGLSEARQRKAAERVRDELTQVARFQEEQFAGIDAQAMGIRLRAGLLDKVRAAAERSQAPPAEVEARVHELEKLIAGSDFTGMALESLQDDFFQPALTAIDAQFADQPLVMAQLLQSSADTLRDVGLLEAASRPQEEALAIRRRELGDEHPDTLTSIAAMGLLIRAQGNLAEAEPYYREALDSRRRVLGDEHADTLRSMSNMGALLQAQGKLTQAERYYRDALKKRRRVLGEEHPDTLTSLASVGYLLTAQGKWDEAEPYYRDVLEKRRRILGDDHPHTLFAINNMAALLQTQLRFSEAETLYTEALERRRRVLGDDHPDTLQSLNNLGNLLQTLGKAEAEAYYREALEKRRRVLGDEHPYTLNSIQNLATLLLSQGGLEEAELLTGEALEQRRRLLGGDHPDTLMSMNHMALLWEKQGRLAEAEAYHRQVFEGLRRVLGDEHPYTFKSLANLSSLLQTQGKHLEAVELLVEAEPTARRKFADGNAPRLGRFLIDLGHARVAAGQFEAAEANLTEAHEILYADGVGQEWRPHDVLNELAQLYDAWGRPHKANEYRLLLDESP
jgi:non-specific serine/threonine protein kinase/serine/threonine-protein kinase